MKKILGFIMGLIAVGILGVTVAILDVGSVGGAKVDIDIEESVKELEKKEEKKEDEKEVPKEPIKDDKEVYDNENMENREDYLKRVETIIKETSKEYDFDISASFRDLKTNEVIYVNNRKTSSASMIKVFIMLEVYNQVAYGHIKIFDELKLEEKDKVSGDGILKNKENGSSYTIKELVDLMISKSDNTATNMLIDLVGIDNINMTIESLGCKQTVLRRKMMDEDKKDKGVDNYTSAKDLDLLFNKLYRGECLGNEYDKVMIETLLKCENKNKLVSKLPNNIMVAHKTGELRGVENDGGIVFTDRGDYIINVLVERANKKDAEKVISIISEKIYFEVIANNK